MLDLDYRDDTIKLVKKYINNTAVPFDIKCNWVTLLIDDYTEHAKDESWFHIEFIARELYDILGLDTGCIDIFIKAYNELREYGYSIQNRIPKSRKKDFSDLIRCIHNLINFPIYYAAINRYEYNNDGPLMVTIESLCKCNYKPAENTIRYVIKDTIHQFGTIVSDICYSDTIKETLNKYGIENDFDFDTHEKWIKNLPNIVKSFSDAATSVGKINDLFSRIRNDYDLSRVANAEELEERLDGGKINIDEMVSILENVKRELDKNY